MRIIIKDEEITSANGSIILGSSSSLQVKALKELYESFPDLWIDRGRNVDVPESKSMPVPLVLDWKDTGPGAAGNHQHVTPNTAPTLLLPKSID